MNELQQLLIQLDQRILSVFEVLSKDNSTIEKTNHINALGDKSLKMDLILEDTIIDFFKEKKFPCIIEAEERGRTVLSNNPQYLVIFDPMDGSTNFSKGIPLVCCGVSIALIPDKSTTASFDDIEFSFVRSFYTNEFYFAQKNKGATLNGKIIHSNEATDIGKAIISIDIDHLPKKEIKLLSDFKKLIRRCRGTRRFGTNLLDIVYVGAGKIEAMIDLRGNLSAVHVPSLFISQEAGAEIYSPEEEQFNPELKAKERMKFIIANNQVILNTIKEILRFV